MYGGGGTGNRDDVSIATTGFGCSNSFLGWYGYGSNGCGEGSPASTGNPGVVIIRYAFRLVV